MHGLLSLHGLGEVFFKTLTEGETLSAIYTNRIYNLTSNIEFSLTVFVIYFVFFLSIVAHGEIMVISVVWSFFGGI